MSLKNNSLVAVAAVTAMSAGFWLSSMQNDAVDSKSHERSSQEQALADARKNFSPIQGSLVTPARKIAVPELIKHDGQPFSLKDLTGHWSLLFFGFTNCPDICPTTLGVAAQAKKIAAEKAQDFPQVIFISVDPERDKVEMLGDYIQYFDKDFIGVTGDSNLIKALTLQMSVVYMKMPAEENDVNNYQVDHSSALLLLNPEGKLVAFLNPPHDAATILKDFQTVLNEK